MAWACRYSTVRLVKSRYEGTTQVLRGLDLTHSAQLLDIMEMEKGATSLPEDPERELPG